MKIVRGDFVNSLVHLPNKLPRGGAVEHWNHRVIEFVDFDGTPYRQIHEVHYEDGIPYGYTENPAVVMGETNEVLRLTLERMLKCLDKPVLVESDFMQPSLPQTETDNP
jgi:hypothetical protein